MAKDFNIRLFTKADLAEVVQINQTCLPENYSSSFYLDIHRRFPLTFLVATMSGKVVGYIMCRVEIGFSRISNFKISKKGHIISLAVLPPYRRQGVAHALLSKALQNVSEYGTKECYLEVRTSNELAIDLYKDFEFKNTRRIRSYYRDGEDAYVLTKALDA